MPPRQPRPPSRRRAAPEQLRRTTPVQTQITPCGEWSRSLKLPSYIEPDLQRELGTFRTLDHRPHVTTPLSNAHRVVSAVLFRSQGQHPRLPMGRRHARHLWWLALPRRQPSRTRSDGTMPPEATNARAGCCCRWRRGGRHGLSASPAGAGLIDQSGKNKDSPCEKCRDAHLHSTLSPYHGEACRKRVAAQTSSLVAGCPGRRSADRHRDSRTMHA